MFQVSQSYPGLLCQAPHYLDYEVKQAPGALIMDKHLLLGVDGGFSTPTQWALRVVNQLFEQSSGELHLLLLTVIPVPYDPSPALMKARGIGQLRPLSATHEQRAQAQDVLCRARALLQRSCPDLVPSCIELVQRFGEPSHEVIKVAREQQTDCIVLGSRGNSSIQNLRRLCTGSTSREIMRLAPCPVMLVTPPQDHRLPRLVTWYERAITHYLQEQLDDLTMFTPEEVTRMFVPPSRIGPTQHKKLTAAAQALEHLARRGQLMCQIIGGERQYVNILDRYLSK
jgi:nucleotide-binding universal stress UspA family protein